MNRHDADSSIDHHSAAQDRERELLALLEEARQSLIDHARQLPLSKRDHGPVLVKIDAATGRNRRAAS